MKKYIILTLVLLLQIISVPAFAEDILPASEIAKVVQADKLADKIVEKPSNRTVVIDEVEDVINCTSLKKEISDKIYEPATCWTDEECQPVSWGCPWQYNPCHYSIYSTSEKEKNLSLSQKVATYAKSCLSEDSQLQAKCDKFNNQANETKQCHINIELVCLSGKCATPIDVILQPTGDAVDIYGSREKIGNFKDDIINR